MSKIARIASAKPRQFYDSRTYRPGRRTFSNEVKRLAWKRCAITNQIGIVVSHQCQGCTAAVTGAGDIVFDHIIPWELSRDSTFKNCQVLCLTCDDLKTSNDLSAIAEADRKADFHLGITGPGKGKHPLPCGKANKSPWSKTVGGRVVPRRNQIQKHHAAMARRRIRE
jgi:hypothetical protein